MLIKKLKLHWPKLLSTLFFFLLIGSYTNLFAIGQPYNPGETLDPACPPGEVNCTVLITGGSSVWTTNGNDIYYNTGNVGIGLISPNNLFQVEDLINFDNTDYNTKLGYQAGKNIISGSQANTFVGYESGFSGIGNINADYNTAIGNSTLYSNTAGYNNAAIGSYSLYYNTTGYLNSAVGALSLVSNTTGINNTAMGADAMYYNTSGYGNSSYGVGSLMYNVGNHRSTAIGLDAMLYADNRSVGRETFNTALGYEALRGTTTAANNTGQYNTAIGDSALLSNSSGYNNSAVGYGSLYSNTTGYYNTALGYQSGRYISDGLTVNDTSDFGVYLGHNTKAGANNNQNEIVIGYDAIGNGSNTATIGNTSLLRTYLTGVNLKAGTATTGTAPLKLTAGTNLTTAETGAMEYDGTNLYFTPSGTTRRTIAYTDSNITGTAGGLSSTLGVSSGGTGLATVAAGSVLGYNTLDTASAITSTSGTRVLTNTNGTITWETASGGMVYPGAGIPNSTGSAWGTSYTTTGSGTVLALATTPTFTTNITTPLIIGGTTTTSPLTLRSTSGVGTTGADIIFQTGNNGATEAMRILNNGRVGIGTASPNSLFQVAGLISFDTTEYNTEIGQETGLNLVAGAQYNTFLGHQAGRGGNTGGTDAADNNTAIGYRAFYANTTGASNTAIGNYALTANTTGNSNSAIGTRALYSNTGGYNNTANGMYALYSNLTGNYNNANGQYSLYSNTTGGYNTAFGNYSLNANVAGSRATAFGYNAMRYANSSATPFFNYNLAIGYEALMGTTTSANNTGNHNTAIGYQSLSGYETASRNTAIGYFSGQSVLGGNNNLLLGYQVGDALTSGSNNIALGYDVDLPSATADNQMTIGNLIFASGGFGTGTTVGSGFIGIGKNNPAQRLDVSGNTAISGQTMLGLTSVSTSAQLSLSNTINTNGSSTAIAGIHGDYTFNNGGSSGYVQVGNRFVFNNAPTTNSNTMVGEIIRTIDNTSLANLVRGLDITSNAGSNTAGTNTGLRATGGTFGVQGITTGLAGGVSVPAALYGENTGATNGNILRLFSNSMTSAPSFATFYHDTSTFTGTGLLMDFATGSGTFSGNFVDFQRNNTTLFRVTNAGIVSLGLSSTASTTAVCSSLANGVSPTSGVSYELRDCSGSPVADYAEMYPVENGIEKGDIVATGNELINTYDTTNGEIDWNKIKGKVTKLIKSDHPYQKNIIGIVSDNYNDFSSTGYNIKEENNPIPVALSGRVPVKISLTSESIKAGDYVTTSNESGKATKATKAGFVIGKALEDWNNVSGKNTLMVFVEQGFYNGQSIESFIGIEIESDENILENIFAKQVLNKLIENQENGEIISSEILTDRLVSGLEIITPEVTTSKLYVKNEIIIDGLSFFNGQALFFDSVTFEKEVSFEVPPLFNKDTAGFALIKQGTKFVRINFENPYISNPVVTASISFEGDEGESEIDPDEFFGENIQYLINEKGPSGFTIVLNQEAPFDIRFSWIALSVKDPNIYESVIDGLIIEGSQQDDDSDESQDEVLSDEIKEEIDLNLDQEQDIDIEEVITEEEVSIEEDVSDNQVQIEEDNPDISTEENSEAEGLSDNEII